MGFLMLVQNSNPLAFTLAIPLTEVWEGQFQRVPR